MILGVLSIWLIGGKGKFIKWGYIAGLASEPFWAALAVRNGDWGVMILVVLYSVCFVRGLKNHWRD